MIEDKVATPPRQVPNAFIVDVSLDCATVLVHRVFFLLLAEKRCESILLSELANMLGALAEE